MEQPNNNQEQQKQDILQNDRHRKKLIILIVVFAALAILSIFFLPILNAIFGAKALSVARLPLTFFSYGMVAACIVIDIVLIKMYIELK